MRLVHLLPCLMLAALGAARAQPVQLFVMDVPPLTSKSGARHGVLGEIVLEALARAGIKPQLQFPPNNRAIVVVRLPTSRDQLIIPLARVPEREHEYTWIAPLHKVDRAFFSTKTRIDSYTQARTTLHSVAVARGTVAPVILRAEDFSPQQIYEINDNDNVPRMLLAERMDAWFGPVEQMRLFLQGVPRREKVIEGAVVGSTDNYLACSRQCDPALVSRLRSALAKMEHDGTIKAIRARYVALPSP